MRKKIISYYIILVIIGVTITGFFVSELSQNLYKGEVEQKLASAASLIDYQLTDSINNNEKIDYNQLAKSYAKILLRSSNLLHPDENASSRVTFVDYKGKVLGDSDANYLTMENHLGRKEVQEAIKGLVGVDVRTSKTLKLDFLYVAIPATSTRMVIRVSVPLSQLKIIDRNIWLYCLAGILAGILITLLLALKISSSMIRPVKELISISKGIYHGNYSNRARIRSHDELGELAASFNEMAEKLETTVADLVDKNIKFDSIMNSMTNGFIAVDRSGRIILINSLALQLFDMEAPQNTIGKNLLEVVRNHRINELVMQTIKDNATTVNEISLNLSGEKVFRVYTNPIISTESTSSNNGGILSLMDITNIKKLEQIRTDFVSNVTHELKTPLTSIRGFVETLRSGAMDDHEVADKFLEIIDIEAERLYILINDILQLSEIETMQKDTNTGRYNLKEIMAEVLSILDNTAAKKGVTITQEVDGSIMINANRDRIKQLLINLIDNAVKYNVENGSVTVKASKAEGRLVISVKDTGIGIAGEHIPRIFERFYRVDKGRSRSMGGTGLGLSIVKHLVNLYNGDIRIESEPGKGSEFIVQLPM